MHACGHLRACAWRTSIHSLQEFLLTSDISTTKHLPSSGTTSIHPTRSPVTLIALDTEHSDALFGLIAANREHLHIWLPWVDRVNVPEDTADFIARTLSSRARGEAAVYLIAAEQSFVGTISLNSIEAGSATVGYWLAADQQKKGIMTAALRQLVTIAMDTLKLTSLRLDVLNGNTASTNVALRCGFRRLHTLDDGTVLHGKIVTRHVYAYP